MRFGLVRLTFKMKTKPNCGLGWFGCCGFLLDNTIFCPKENRFLKIGKAGDRSKARFTSHHYNPGSANSNLAKSLLKDNELKNKYNFNEQNIKQWIKENCQRMDILFDISLGQFANELFESIFHYKYEPRYEG